MFEIRELLSRLRENYTLPGLAGFYILLLLYHTHSFLTTVQLAGRDLIGAYSLVETFRFGWSTEWFLGFPMFKFYPPGFFFTADKLGMLLGDLLAFKLLIYLSLVIFPLTVYFCFRSLFDRRTGILSFILSFAIVFLREPFSLVYQTLQVGLVAQMFALPFLFLYIRLLWSKKRDSVYLLGLLMALMIISHPYIAAVAVVYTGIYFAFERNLFRVIASSTGFLLTAWWWIPVLEKSWYMQNYVGPTGKLVNWPWVFMPLFVLDRSRKAVSLIALSMILLVIGTFNLGVEIQFYRFYIYGQMIAVLAAAPGLKKAISILDDRIKPEYAVFILFTVFLASSINTDISEDWKSDVELEEVVPENGRMIVETSHSDVYNSYVPIQKIPLESNVTVVNGLYADSSISSPYLLGLEKALAENPVPNPIAVEANLSSEQLEKQFEYFGIEYALVRTDHAREKLGFMEQVASNKDLILLKHETNRNKIQAIPVKGEYSDWEELNREAFRTNLTPIIYLPKEQSAVPISEFGNKSRLRDKQRENYSVSLQSIKPDKKMQALFGLKIN